MLTSKQRSYVKSKAQHIKATFQIGANELHENNVRAIRETFNTKEILKIKVNRVNKEDKEITRKMAEQIAKEVEAQVVGVIGTTIILYKQHKDKDMRMDING